MPSRTANSVNGGGGGGAMFRKKRPLNNDGKSGNIKPVKKSIVIRKKQKLSDTTRTRGSSPSGRGSSKGGKNGAKRREKTAAKMEVEEMGEKNGPQQDKTEQSAAGAAPITPKLLFTGEDIELDEQPLISTKSSFKDLTYRSIIEIATFLDPIEITQLSLCSKLMYPLTRHSTIWAIHYRKTMSSIISAKAPRTNEWTLREKALWQFATSSKLRVRAKKREQKKAEEAAAAAAAARSGGGGPQERHEKETS
mmetsp:Transcript_19252/g.31335  ORF Transcript_19252/g.31335 Transcript_19252/m.31335 type:complete len:251 (+) Transcript_19252:70-822(+)